MEDEKAQEVIRRYTSLKSGRTNWDSNWDEVAKFVMPRKDNVYGQLTPGEKTANRLFDTEAIRANDDLAAALHGMLTNPSVLWFGLSTGDRKLDKNNKVATWLHDSAVKMHNVLNSSNFQTEILEVYTDLGSIGTSTLRMEEDAEDTIRFYNEQVYEVFIDENNKGDVDMVTRSFKWNKRKILQEYGETIPAETRKELEDAEPAKTWEIIHEVSPRDEMAKKDEIGQKAMPWQSLHVLRDKGIMLRESGFHEYPYATPRWTKINKEKYGRSPAMKVMADIKMVNSMMKVTIQSAQLAMLPPLQVPDTGFLAPLKLAPASRNYKRGGMKDKVEPLFTGARPDIGLEMVERVSGIIHRGFFLDKFNVDLGDRATTVEVIQRRTEQLRTLGPVSGRMHRELLKPVIDRLYGIMERGDLFDEVPEEIKKDKLDIKYLSAIAQAQLASQSDNISRAIGASGGVIQMNPEVMDNIDGDAVVRKNFDIYGVDPSLLRSEDEVKELRRQRQEAQAAAAQQEADAAQADVINKVGQVDGQTT